MPAIVQPNTPGQTLVSIPTPVPVPPQPKAQPAAPQTAAPPQNAQPKRSVFRQVANAGSLIIPYPGKSPSPKGQSAARANYRRILRAAPDQQMAKKEQPKRFASTRLSNARVDQLKTLADKYRARNAAEAAFNRKKNPRDVYGDAIFDLAPEKPMVGSPFVTRKPKITIDNGVSAQDFIDTFGRVPHPEDLAAMTNHVDGVETLIHNRNGPIESHTYHAGGSGLYHAARTFHANGKVENDTFRKTPDWPIAVKGADILRAQAEALSRHGFDHIDTYAGGDPSGLQARQRGQNNGYIGYFVWPKLGFDGVLERRHLSRLQQHGFEFDPSEEHYILDHINDPDFYDAWKHHAGSDIDLRFDLKPNSASWDQLRTHSKWFPGDQSPHEELPVEVK